MSPRLPLINPCSSKPSSKFKFKIKANNKSFQILQLNVRVDSNKSWIVMMEKPHLYKIFKYSKMNKTVVKTIIEMPFIINKMLNYSI